MYNRMYLFQIKHWNLKCASFVFYRAIDYLNTIETIYLPGKNCLDNVLNFSIELRYFIKTITII